MTRRLWVPLLHRLAFAILSAGTASAYAVSLGPVQLLSGLGQPLRATIPLSNESANDPTCVKARLELSDGTVISAPRINLTHNGQTEIIDLSTKQSINEPAVILHVATGCGTATYHNYQLLLDPVQGGTTAYPMKAATFNAQQTRRVARAEQPAKAKSAANTQAEQSATRKSAKSKATESAQLPTLTKEMSLSSNQSNNRARSHTSATPKNANWIPEDSITPMLKLSASLADMTAADDAQQTEEAKAAQMRFEAIINGEDVTQTAETKMKAAQEKMLLLQADNEQKKQQAQAEKLVQDEKRKESFPLTWFAGLAALVLICLATIAWIAFKLIKAKKSQAAHSWKNYHAASDTLIADLSTQTLLDSEFMTTVGEPYNTAVFSDTQFDQDPDIEDDDLEDSIEEEQDSEASVAPSPAPAASRLTEEEPTVEKHATPKASPPPSAVSTSPSSPPTSAQPAAKQNDAHMDAAKPASPAPGLRKTTPHVAGQAEHRNNHAASNTTAQPAPVSPATTAGALKKQNETAPTLNVKEIADIMQQAEFWMLLQDPFRAIEILEPYRDVAQPESPVPWIYLLDLYRMVGDKKKYESLIVRIEYVFNAKIPRWDGQFGITPRTLNDFPHVVEKICELWETDEIVPYLESLLLDRRDGARQGFDLPVYRNIIQLITLAREPETSKEHAQLRYGKAQAILFSQQTPNPEQTARPVPSKPAPDATTGAKLKAEPVTQDVILAEEIPQLPKAASVTTVEKAAADIAAADNPISAESKNAVTPSRQSVEPSPSQATEHVEHVAHEEQLAADTVEYGNASSMETKLELALAYQEIGEKDGARELLYEVIKDGSSDQSEKAKLILKGIN